MDMLLTQSGDVAANSTESRRTLLAAETARHLLVHLSHAQVSFRLVVVKGHCKIMHEAQHIFLIIAQAHQQVVGFALLYLSTPRFQWRGIGRVAQKATGHQLAIVPLKLPKPPLPQASLPRVTRCVYRTLDLYKQRFHLPGPLLPLFLQCLKLPQMMGVAQGMATLVHSEALVPVMHGHSPEEGQHPHCPGASLSTSPICLVQGQMAGRSYMQPLPLTLDVHTCVVKVGYFGLLQALLDRLLHPPQLGGRTLLCLVES